MSGQTQHQDRRTPSFKDYGGSAPENYQRYFVPAIGAPLAADLIDAAGLSPGERVLDVACGTGVVARLAAERVGPDGTVGGLDINPGMLAVAQATTPPDMAIDWHEANAQAVPLPDASYDAVLCQMGLQFFPDKQGALREMRRLLAPGGRMVLNLPGPTPSLFGILADAMADHIRPEVAGFVHQVFSLHDADEIEGMITHAGFTHVAVHRETARLHLPPATEFLWQYVHSTPLIGALSGADSTDREALERDVVDKWEPYAQDDGMQLEVGVSVATARTE